MGRVANVRFLIVRRILRRDGWDTALSKTWIRLEVGVIVCGIFLRWVIVRQMLLGFLRVLMVVWLRIRRIL